MLILRTGDIVVEDIIFLDDIIQDLLRGFVYNQHFPLYDDVVKSASTSFGGTGTGFGRGQVIRRHW